MAFLTEVRALMISEQTKIQTHGFVFDNLDDRWQKLAFTLYTDIARLSSDAEELLDAMEEKEAQMVPGTGYPAHNVVVRRTHRYARP
jgi:hypothetical protein